MALIFEGGSECVICGKVLNKEKEYTGLAPLTNNTKDNLYLFSDAGMHVDCLHQHPMGQLAIFYAKMCRESFQPTGNRCIADGQIIADGNYVGFMGFNTLDHLMGELKI